MIKRLLENLEIAEQRFYRSPWSTGIALVGATIWIVVETARHKGIGFDGAFTIASIMISLATIRRLGPIRPKRRWLKRLTK